MAEGSEQPPASPHGKLIRRVAFGQQGVVCPDGLVAWRHDHALGGAARLKRRPQFKVAIAFYPGCREIAELDGWRPRVPLKVLIGGADDWTQAGPLPRARQRAGFKFIEYPGAYHGFDAPELQGARAQGPRRREGRRSACGHRSRGAAAAIKEVMGTLAAALGGP